MPVRKMAIEDSYLFASKWAERYRNTSRTSLFVRCRPPYSPESRPSSAMDGKRQTLQTAGYFGNPAGLTGCLESEKEKLSCEKIN